MRTFATLAALALVAYSGSSAAGRADDIVAAEKCNKCHTATTTKKGPSWAALAEKYKGKPEMAPKLEQMLKTGVPLSGKTAEEDLHKKVAASDADIKAVVETVLSSK